MLTDPTGIAGIVSTVHFQISRFAGINPAGVNGGSVNVGFNGTDTSQDPPPTAFYLDNTVCAMN
jgi:hypothetical protein